MKRQNDGCERQIADSELPGLLHKKYISDVFTSFILDGKSLDELGFEEERHRIFYEWPVYDLLDESSFPIRKADGFGEFGTFDGGGTNPPLIRKRFRTLLDWLRKGQLVACWHDRDNQLKEVPRYLWSRPDVYIDFLRGDLVERKIGHSYRTLIEGLVLMKSESRFPDSHIPVPRDETVKLTPSEQAVHEVIINLYPDGIPAGLRAKVRNNKINQWLVANNRTPVSGKTIQRYFAKMRS